MDEAKGSRDAIVPFLRDGVSACRRLRVAQWFSLCSELNGHGLLMQYASVLAGAAPTPVARRITAARARHDAKMARRLRAFFSFADAAEEEGLRFAIIKGMATSKELYGDEFARDSGDIDILVASDDLFKADYAARRVGWVQPGEAWRARRMMDAGVLDAVALQAMASPYSLRSSTFLPHVTNYYFAGEEGQIDSLEVHDRFCGVEAARTVDLLWSGLAVELGGRLFVTCGGAAGLVLSALSLYEDSELVRPNTSSRSDAGLKSCVDVRKWMLRLAEYDELGQAGRIAVALGVEREVGTALGRVSEVFPDVVDLASRVSPLRPSVWSTPYVDRALDSEARAARGVCDLDAAFGRAARSEAFASFALGRWRDGRRLPSTSGVCLTPFLLRMSAVAGRFVLDWQVPLRFVSFEALTLQVVLVCSGCGAAPMGARVNLFCEADEWVVFAIPLVAGAIDGHANKMRRGVPCEVEVGEDESGLHLRVAVPAAALPGSFRADEVLVVPSANERITGQVFRRCAGWDFMEVAEAAMGLCPIPLPHVS